MNRMQHFLRRIPFLLCTLTGALFTIIVLEQVCGQNALAFAYRNASLLSNIVLLPVALLFIAALMYLRSRERKADKESVWPVRILFIIVLGVQFLVARTCWSHLGWDPGTVHATAEALARGLDLPDPAYFISCPNNAPVTILMAVPLWVAVKIGLAVPYVVLPYIDAVLLNLSAYICWECVRFLTQSRTARGFALTLALGWIALSPYIVYPYTDVFSILFPALSLLIYLRCRRPVLKWLLISLLCFFGAAIKPTVLIFLIALVLVSLCRFFAQGGLDASAWKRLIAVGAALVIGAVPGKCFQDLSTAHLAGSATPEKQLSMTHYLMLGMNGETYGGHSPDDVAFTLSFDTLKENQAANLERAWERVSERGLWGNIEFFAVKLFKAYADGTFTSHGSFLEIQLPKRTDALSSFLRSFYTDGGVWLPYCQTIVQCLWLGVLTLCAVAAFRCRRHPAVALLCLTLLGLTAYLLLFEVWPRYLFLYAPFFVILAAMAFDPLSAKS